jgi:hypothetical protein
LKFKGIGGGPFFLLHLKVIDYLNKQFSKLSDYLNQPARSFIQSLPWRWAWCFDETDKNI